MVVYGWYYRVVLHIMWRAMLRSLHINLRVRFRPQSPDCGHTHDLASLFLAGFFYQMQMRKVSKFICFSQGPMRIYKYHLGNDKNNSEHE